MTKIVIWAQFVPILFLLIDVLDGIEDEDEKKRGEWKKVRSITLHEFKIQLNFDAMGDIFDSFVAPRIHFEDFFIHTSLKNKDGNNLLEKFLRKNLLGYVCIIWKY